MPRPDINEETRRRTLKKYRMTLEHYNTLRAIQKFRCRICTIPESALGEALVVDHDHITGEVRGLLCSRCNSGLGMFKDSPKRMIQAALYLLRGKDGLNKFKQFCKTMLDRAEQGGLYY